MICRPGKGRSVIIFWSTVVLIDASSVLSSASRAVMVTVSFTSPTERVRSTRASSLVETCTRSAREVLKPVSSAVTEYVPKIRNGTRYVPLGPVVTTLEIFVPVFKTVTFTPGITDALASRTSPLIAPVIS